jgi:PAS domain S-box-containing protein
MMPSVHQPGAPHSALSATLQGILLPLARATINMRLIAIVLGLAVPLNIVVALVIWRLAGAANEAQRTSLLYVDRSIAAAVDAELGKYISLARMLSRDPALQADNLDGFEAGLREQLADVPDICAVVADRDGQELLNTGAPKGQPLPTRPPEGIEAQRRAFQTGRVAVSDIYRPAALSPGNWRASANIGIFRDGEPLRALAFTMDARRFVDLLAAQDMPKNWRAAIRDTQGRIVAGAPRQDLPVGEMASENFKTIKNRMGLLQVMSRDGEEFLVANTHSDLSGWTIGIGIKTAELRASVFNAIGWPIALGGALSLLSLVFAIFIARRITGPLAELRQKAEAVLEDPEVSFEPGVPELGELWAALQRGAANRRRSEAIARSTEKRLSQIINTYNGYVGLLDKNGRITEVNVQMLKAIGAPREDVIGQAFADVGWCTHSPQARTEMQELIRRCLDGETVRRDMQYAHDGEIRWLAFQATPLRSADGRVDGVVPAGYDITDRKHAEEALHQSEARFRNLYEHALAGITLSDREGRICACNAAFCNLVGYSEDELCGMHFAGLIHPEDRDDNVARARGLRTGEVTAMALENRYLHKNGTPVWVRKIVSSLPAQAGRPGEFFMVCIDIGPRKQQEEELRQSEARLQLALEADGAGMWENLVENDEFIASEPALTLHGLTPGTAMTRENLLEALHPEDRSRVEQAWRDTLETGAPFMVEVRCRQPDGSTRWLHSQGRLHEIGGQRRLIGLVRDISGRKAAETAVRTSNMRLQLALDAARLGWWLYDPGQLTLSWDSRFEAIFGITDPHADVTAILARILPEDSKRFCDAACAALDPLDPKPFVGEFRIARGSGEIRWIEVYGMTTFEGAGAARNAVAMVGTAADITERKRAEEQQQLSMRELSHRTKNLLSVVLSIANQTAASSPSGFVERFSQRIQALSASLDLLVHSEWRGVEVEALVRAQLAHFADLIGGRIIIDGPPLSVTPSAAQSIGMALHELATNAGKYGSLSNDHGSVTIDWRLDDGQFSIGWVEHHGPRVKPPKRRGFGSTIISTVVEHSVGGEVELAYAASGIVWRLKCSANKALNPGV